MTETPMEDFVKANEEVAEAINRCNRETWRMQELRNIVDEYMENSLISLDFLSALSKCIEGTRKFLTLILLTMQLFDEEEAQAGASNSDQGDGNCDGQIYARTLETLSKLKAVGNPFTEEFFITFQMLHRRQKSMLEKLEDVSMKLDKKTKGIEACRMVLSAIVSATSMTTRICSDGVAELAAPPVPRVVKTGVSSVMGLIRGCGSKDSERGVGECIEKMRVEQHVATCNLDTLHVLVDKLKLLFEEMMQVVDFVTEGGPVKLVMEAMRKMLEVFGERLEDLGIYAGFARDEEIRRARILLQQMASKIPKRD